MGGVNVPDQHVYKVIGGPADGSHVLMDETDPKYGMFNRAQRAVQNFGESFPMVLGDFVLSGYILPWTTAACTTAYGVLRVKGSLDYADERTKRTSGQMSANIFSSVMGGIV